MSYHRIRRILLFLFLLIGIVLHVSVGISGAWYLYAASFILLLTHYLFGTVWSALGMLKKGKLLEAELLLDEIKRPDWLARKHNAYYHFIKGMIALQKKELKSGKSNILKALETGLSNKNDQALAHLNLAHIHYVSSQPQEAKDQLEKAKACNTKDLMIQQNVEKLEQALK
ncbi:MAG: hypothetical protein GY705_14945 [Bacteroidetes bacterium]|nr:hypothetical protein [Bacteroidota bacterium]